MVGNYIPCFALEIKMSQMKRWIPQQSDTFDILMLHIIDDE